MAVGTNARVWTPEGMALSGDGTALYVVESGNHQIREIILATAANRIFAGTGSSGLTEGTGTSAALFNPTDVEVVGTFALYVAETLANRVRKFTLLDAKSSTFAGSMQGFLNAVGATAQFNQPNGVAHEPVTGTLLVLDSGALSNAMWRRWRARYSASEMGTAHLPASAPRSAVSWFSRPSAMPMLAISATSAFGGYCWTRRTPSTRRTGQRSTSTAFATTRSRMSSTLGQTSGCSTWRP